MHNCSGRAPDEVLYTTCESSSEVARALFQQYCSHIGNGDLCYNECLSSSPSWSVELPIQDATWSTPHGQFLLGINKGVNILDTPYWAHTNCCYFQRCRTLLFANEIHPTLVKAKDTIPLEAKAAVIYQFPCKGCNAKYVGETGKTLKTRMKQHKAVVRNRYMSYLTTMHSLDTGHQFAFDEAQII